MRRFAPAMLERGKPATIVYYNAKYLDAFGGDPRFTVGSSTIPGSATARR